MTTCITDVYIINSSINQPVMKSKFFLVILAVLLLGACKKDVESDSASLKIKIDYMGDGGYYDDNIDGVPQGLSLGMNGPFTTSAKKSYSMVYKANANFGEATISNWTPTTGVIWVIHCYVLGNTAYIESYPE
jgi:hypothetical protein